MKAMFNAAGRVIVAFEGNETAGDNVIAECQLSISEALEFSERLAKAISLAHGTTERLAERVDEAKAKNLTNSGRLNNSGRPWNTDEDKRLLQSFNTGKTIAELSAIHQRSKWAVEARLARLGATWDDGRPSLKKLLESHRRAADELPERDFYEGDSPDH